MKRILLMLLVVLLAGPAFGAPDGPEMQQVVLRLDLLQLTDAAAAKLGTAPRVAAGYVGQAVQSGQASVVQTIEMMAVTGRDAQAIVGRKTPVVYFDPRPSQFQIQYVDTGLKLTALCRPQSGGLFEVIVTAEYSTSEGMRTPGGPTAPGYPVAGVVTARTQLTQARFGDAFVVSRAHGPEARRMLAPAGASGDHLVMILTLVRP